MPSPLIRFDPVELGGLPTHARTGCHRYVAKREMTLSAYRGGVLLGTVTGFQVAEGEHFTEQDRFYGFADLIGIDRIVISSTTNDWSMDHLQYGRSAGLGSPPIYSYAAHAIDPDSDPLAYSLPSHPDGMVIDPVQGIINWRPAVDQIGNHSVTVSADDGHGGIAYQTFSISVGPDPANDPPVIVSTPVTSHDLPPASNLPTGNVTPASIHVELGLGDVATRTVAVTVPASVPAHRARISRFRQAT